MLSFKDYQKKDMILIREKAVIYGENTLTNEELLSLILGVPKEKFIRGEKLELIEIFEDAEKFDLTNLQKNKLKAIFELCKRLNKKNNLYTIKTPKDVANYLNDMKFYEQEVFKVLLLDTKNQIIGVEEISKGTLGRSIVHPRDVFRLAIKKNARSIILAHNHPSGIVTPSKEDIEITKKLAEIGRIIDIQVLDHVIIGNEYISLKNLGYI